jgi:hypothetical protein
LAEFLNAMRLSKLVGESLGQAGGERHEEFGEVSERRLHDTGRRRPHAPAELLGGATDETRKQRNRRGRGGKRKHGHHLEEMRSRSRSDEKRRQAHLPHIASVHRPMIK